VSFSFIPRRRRMASFKDPSSKDLGRGRARSRDRRRTRRESRVANGRSWTVDGLLRHNSRLHKRTNDDPKDDRRARAKRWRGEARAHMATPRAKSTSARAPERGVFALDHFGECAREGETYVTCVKTSEDARARCRALAETYLRCRMDAELMARSTMEELGLRRMNARMEEKANTSDGTTTTMSNERGERKNTRDG